MLLAGSVSWLTALVPVPFPARGQWVLARGERDGA